MFDQELNRFSAGAVLATRPESGDAQKEALLRFVHVLFERLRPLLRLPWIAQALARLVEIIGPMLGRKADPTHEQADKPEDIISG